MYSFSDDVSKITSLLPKVTKNDKQLSRESSPYLLADNTDKFIK